MLSIRRRRAAAVPALVLIAASVLAALASAAPSASAPKSSAPPGGVYTCEWIAANPGAAAQAMVTCDAAVFHNAIERGASPTTQMLRSQGCADVPSSGAVGQGVFAWSSYQYSTYWGWYGRNSPASYTWYVQTTGGTYTYGNVYDTNNHYVGVPANIYRWGAQNNSSTAQSWYVCWNDN